MKTDARDFDVGRRGPNTHHALFSGLIDHLVLGVQLQVDAKCVIKELDVNINIAMLDKTSLIAKPE